MKRKTEWNHYDEMQKVVRYRSGFQAYVVAILLSFGILVLDMIGLRFTNAQDALLSVMLLSMSYFLYQVIVKGAYLDRYQERNAKMYGILFLIILCFQGFVFVHHVMVYGYSLFASTPTLDDLPITSSFLMFLVVSFGYFLHLWKEKKEDTWE